MREPIFDRIGRLVVGSILTVKSCEHPVRSREEYCSPLLGAPPQDTPGRSIGLVRLSKHKHGCMIREYKRIGHFGMVSLLFLIFFGVFAHTR